MIWLNIQYDIMWLNIQYDNIWLNIQYDNIWLNIVPSLRERARKTKSHVTDMNQSYPMSQVTHVREP